MAVGSGEGVVAFEAAFEAGDVVGPYAEVVGDGGESDVCGSTSRAEVAVVVDRAGCGEVFEHLAGDSAFEHPQDLFFGPAGGGLAGDVVAGALVVGHADQGDAVQGVVGGAVAAAGESVAAGFPDEAGMGATPVSIAKEASLRSRWGLVPAVMIS